MDNEVKKRLDWINEILPEPFKTEFNEDVLIDSGEDYDMRTLNKVFTYYITDCQDELSDDIKNKIAQKYLVIQLNS